jgi:hypothetical protein
MRRYDVPPEWLDRDLVFQFFWRFSVFECALKREGFLRPARPSRDAAEPDWDGFARAIAGRFQEVRVSGFQEAAAALAADPPQRQVVRENRLAWAKVEQGPGESYEAFMLRILKTARNNLFHGGKYPDGPIDEIARNRAILRGALTILDGCYELHPGIARRASEAA